MRRCVMGLDIGTTCAKACVVEESGHVLGTGSAGYGLLTHGDAVEQQVVDWIDGAAKAARAALETAGEIRVEGISLSTQGGTTADFLIWTKSERRKPMAVHNVTVEKTIRSLLDAKKYQTLKDVLVTLEPADIGDIARAVRKCRAAYHGRIEKLFRTSEYLISPEEDPERFLQGQYFLSPAQDYVKAELLRDIAGTPYCAFFHIYGKPCTGKTLLVYDLAKHLSGIGKTLITCGEEPSGGLISISESIENLDFVAVLDIACPEQISGYDFILVDEALRVEPASFGIIVKAAETYEQVCIFSTDPTAILTVQEQENDILERIHTLGLSGEYELSERLRLNMELQTFILKLKNLGCKTEKNYEFEHVSVNYANNTAEAHGIIKYFREKGYVFINPHRRSDDPFADLEESFGYRHIAGREYGSVVMLMDGSFSYDKDGYLMGIPVPDPGHPYPNIFYPGITRVREHLALVILDAPELLNSILSILD